MRFFSAPPLLIACSVIALAVGACAPTGSTDRSERESLAPIGLLVVDTKPGVSGAKAGILARDRIVEAGELRSTLNGEETTLDLARWGLLNASAGTLGPIPLEVERDGQVIQIELGSAPWGIEVAPPLPLEAQSALESLPEPAAVETLQRLAQELSAVDAVWIFQRIADKAWDDETLRAEALGTAISTATASSDASSDADALTWAWWQQGQLFWRHNDHVPAREAFGKAIDRLNDRPLLHAAVLIRRGISFFNSSNQRQAQADFERAVDRIREVTPRSTNLAMALNLIAQCQTNRQELEPAEQNLAAAAEIIEEIDPEHRLRAQIEYQTGRVALKRGDYSTADLHYDHAAELYRAAGIVDRDTGMAVMGMSVLASMRGDIERAEDLVRQAQTIFQTNAPGSPHHVWALRNRGTLAGRRGHYETAGKLFAEALDLASHRGGEDSAGVGEVHWNLAELAEMTDRLDDALAHLRRALEIFEVRLPESTIVPSLQSELGRIAIDLGNYREAREFLEASADRWRVMASGGWGFGWTDFQLGRLARAEGDLEQALTWMRAAHANIRRLAPNTVSEALVLHETAEVLRNLGRIDEALAAYAAAIEALENQLPRLGSPEVGAKERARHRSLYDDYLDLLIETGETEKAFSLLERSRVRSLLAMLAERDLVFRASIPAQLDRRRRAARAEHSQALDRLARLSDDSPAAAFDEATRDLRLAWERQEQVRIDIRRQAPELARLADPEPLDWTGATRTLDPGTLALSFHVGAETTQLFVLTRDSEPRVETLPIGREELSERVEQARIVLQNPATRPRTSEPIISLSRSLLSPVEPDLRSAERLLLVPDGPLHRLPIGALLALPATQPEPQSGVRFDYLAERWPIRFTSSLTLASELAAREASVAEAGLPGVDLVAFGDPQVTQDSSGSAGTRSADLLAPLPHARREVEAIASRFGDTAQIWIGPEATETRAKEVTPGATYVHFATHAVVDERFPLESALVLAKDPSPTAGSSSDAGPEPSGRTGSDGFLRAWEIFEDLKLDADLVTLSACESALGQEQAGEGLIGLTRAFHYAGANSVLASLWPVSDRSTAQLMEHLYEGLRNGLPKDEALRQAQLRLIRHPLPAATAADDGGWLSSLTGLFRRTPEDDPAVDLDESKALDASHPFYWAAFQLYGD